MNIPRLQFFNTAIYPEKTPLTCKISFFANGLPMKHPCMSEIIKINTITLNSYLGIFRAKQNQSSKANVNIM
jgi:hypothetical protein